MTALNQDFTTYAGDAAFPQFTVRNAAGAVIDISTVLEIVWNASRDLNSAPVLAKAMTTGGISLIGGGTGGIFQVNLAASDTQALTAYYTHQARITDASGNVTTIALGRMQAGRAPIWTYSGDPSLSSRDAVRFYINDTNAASPLYYDGEIDYLLTQFPTPLFAAAQAARSLAAKFAGQVTSKSVGDLSISYAEKAKTYAALALSLQVQAEQSGAQLYSGGTSKSDMRAVAANSDRVPQPFTRGQFDITPQSQGPAVPPDGCEG